MHYVRKRQSRFMKHLLGIPIHGAQVREEVVVVCDGASRSQVHHKHQHIPLVHNNVLKAYGMAKWSAMEYLANRMKYAFLWLGH